MTHSRSLNSPPHHSLPPSPDTLFAPPIAPIVLESSPLATAGAATESPQTALPFRSPVSKSPIFIETPNAAGDKTSESHGKNGVAKKGGALAESRGKENRTLSGVSRTANDKDQGCAAYPTWDGYSPIRSPFKARRKSPIDNEQRTAKAKRRRKGNQDQGKSNAAANKIIKSRVTKSSVGGAGGCAALTDNNGIPQSEAETTKNTGDTDVTNLQLEEATKRRAVWTPPKDTALTAIDLTYSPLTSRVATNDFGTLISQYGFGEAYVHEQDIGMLEGPTRKRQLEPVETDRRARIPPCDQAVDNAPTSKPQKNKCAQRTSTKSRNPRATKHTTITSLTTAPYDTSDPTPTAFISTEQTDEYSTKKTSTRPKPKKATKGKKGPSKKREDPQAFKVAAPADSLKSLDDQVLLFGTCSQLARDSSPGFTGPQQSNNTAVQCSKLSNKNPPEPGSKQSLLGLPASKNLWSAASRDANDGLADIEIVDLESPESLQPNHACKKSFDLNQIKGPSIDIDSRSHGSATGRAARKDEEEDLVLEVHGNNEDPVDQHSTLTSGPAFDPGPVDVESNDPQMPHYRGFSTAELAEQVAAFGFKPIRNREKAVSLLEKCWQSRNKKSDRGIATSKPMEGTEASTSTMGACAKVTTSNSTLSSTSASGKEGSARIPMRPTSKSGKNKAKSAQQRRANQSNDPIPRSSEHPSVPSSCEEIADSTDEDCNIASSSNGPGLAPTPSLTDTVGYDSLESTEASQDSTPEIATQITLAIQMQPRMRAVNGTKQPTWYEKILMYDPICLDDLTVWLNTEGLGRIGENSEVNRLTVREWCESKGICCTWRKPGRANR